MNLIKFTTQSGELRLETSRGLIRLTAYSSHIVRIQYTLEPGFSFKESLMVLPEAQTPTEIDILETEDSLFFSTSELSIKINRRTLAFEYLDEHGKILTREPDRGGKSLIPVNVTKFVPEVENDLLVEVGTDGLRVSPGNFREEFDRKAYHAKLEFEWEKGEALYGLGSHEEGMLNLRGQHQYLYQQNMKAVVPIVLSTRGYGILLDNYSLMTFHDDAFGSYLWADIADELDFYFIYGPEFDQIVNGIRELTGKAPMLPRWTFGYIQSKERYQSQAELIAVVQEYRKRGLPMDCIVLDWKSWPEGFWGQKSLDPERFPDPKEMTAELHRLNARLMVSIWPIMYSGCDNWIEMHDQGYLLGNQATYDAFQEKARALYWKQANDGLFSNNIDAWWCDCTEPFESDWKDAFKPEPEERARINSAEAKKYLDPQYINAYSLLHSKGIYEGQRRVTDQKRVVNLTRSSYGGQHRYGTITWSGDPVATWETLRRQIADGLNFYATGSPYWTVDIGAFFVKNKPEFWFWHGDYDLGVEDLGYRELYVRWFQFGAFLSMFRAHGTDSPREIWRFGNPGDPMYDALVKFLRLRYRLLPYIYSLAWQIAHENYTMIRALPFDFRSDPATYNVSDQFMFGPALLVNPVTKPMYYGPNSAPLTGTEKTRPVYLPEGNDWYNFWTCERIAGGQIINAPASLDTMPLYVRAGSIIPFGQDICYADEKPQAMVDLRIYPGQDGKFTLYQDEGDNYNYEKGLFSTIQMRWENKDSRLIIENRQGNYPGMNKTMEFSISVVGQIDEYQLVYDGTRKVIDFNKR